MNRINWPLCGAIVVLSSLVFFLFSVKVSAHDHEHPDLDAWYAGLMQPDNPTISCCGEADAYYADEIHVRDGKTYAVITDDRDDASLNRKHHVDVGTEVLIPDYKLKWDRGNPTGHGVVFLSETNYVWCYVQPGGV